MNDNNPVGSEYIFMEDVVGKQLAREWDNLFANAELTVMREFVATEVKLLSVSFSHYALTYFIQRAGRCWRDASFSYGSIYFANDAVEGAVPAEITSANIPQELKEKDYSFVCSRLKKETQDWLKCLT